MEQSLPLNKSEKIVGWGGSAKNVERSEEKRDGRKTPEQPPALFVP